MGKHVGINPSDLDAVRRRLFSCESVCTPMSIHPSPVSSGHHPPDEPESPSGSDYTSLIAEVASPYHFASTAHYARELVIVDHLSPRASFREMTPTTPTTSGDFSPYSLPPDTPHEFLQTFPMGRPLETPVRSRENSLVGVRTMSPHPPELGITIGHYGSTPSRYLYELFFPGQDQEVTPRRPYGNFEFPVVRYDATNMNHETPIPVITNHSYPFYAAYRESPVHERWAFRVREQLPEDDPYDAVAEWLQQAVPEAGFLVEARRWFYKDTGLPVHYDPTDPWFSVPHHRRWTPAVAARIRSALWVRVGSIW